MLNNKSAKKTVSIHKMLIGILLLSALAISCQHARIQVAAPLPASCQNSNSKQCEQDKLALVDPQKIPTNKIFEVHHNYYLGGLFPRKFVIKESTFCQETGIREIHQLYTFMDGILEQLTAFIYSPRTVRITCN